MKRPTRRGRCCRDLVRRAAGAARRGARGPASGPVVEAPDHDFLREAFARAPTAVTRRPASAALEAFHRDLIRTHLERDLHSHRVMRDVAREIRG